MTGSDKKGPALADIERERQKHLQAETKERLRRFRDSIDLEDMALLTLKTPPMPVFNAEKPSVPPPVSKRSLVPQGPKGWALAIAGLLTAAAALAKAIADVLQ